MVLAGRFLPFAGGLALLLNAWIPGFAATGQLPEEVFATVDGKEISGREYLATLRNEGKKKFYHGQPPEEEFAAFRREIGDHLVDRVLLLKVADERGITSDESWIEEKLNKYIERLSQNPEWQENAETVIPQLRDRLREENLLQKLEERIREIPDPTPDQLQAFYKERGELFTTPERFRVSTIMLRVPPWVGSDQWEAAGLKAQAIWAQLEEGASFEEMAKLHSQDASADEGGDLGFLHRDMLGESAQSGLEHLQIGQFSKPVRVLEGYTILKLTDREPPKLNSFEDVRDRAKALWLRETRDKVWNEFRQNLRSKADIQINESYFSSMDNRLQEKIETRKRADGEK